MSDNKENNVTAEAPAEAQAPAAEAPAAEATPTDAPAEEQKSE